jgi:hypothetical protein
MTADLSSFRNIGLPPHVTRFYGTVDYAIDVIKNMHIAYVHTSMLNYPFDPYCFFETDFGDSYQNLLKYVRANHSADMPWFRSQVTAQSWGGTVRDLKAYLQKLRAYMFMLSTSAATETLHPKDNLYMWGHYGMGHRGVAIEFDTEKLTAAVLRHHETKIKRTWRSNLFGRAWNTLKHFHLSRCQMFLNF